MERTNEERLEFFADMLEPATEILTDPDIARLYQSGKRVQAVATAIKHHKSAAVALLAALQCESAETYRVPNPLSLAAQLLELANSPEVQSLFSSQAQRNGGAASGSVTENIEGGAN